MKLRLGTRGSALALWQARRIDTLLRAVRPDATLEMITFRTTGDRVTDVPLHRMGGTGIFTKELDRALLDGTIDLAVHSLKDVPTRLAEGLLLAAVPERADPRDAYLAGPGMAPSLAELPAGARVGTGSLRRRALLAALRPDVTAVELRGNLDTRLAKLADGLCDAAILAAAGLHRLGREDAISALLEPPAWLPAPAQGALAVVTRADDGAAARLVATLDDRHARAAVTAERAFLNLLEGGCQVPIGALATVAGDAITLHGFAADDVTGAAVRGQRTGSIADAHAVGAALAADLLATGAGPILERVRARALHAGAAPRISAP